ncbi:MAG: SDR family oxidoreductase [bacterium]|nr:SDR family oxidoreductase [bacterium]
MRTPEVGLGLEERIVWVVGAGGGGIGSATSVALAAAGAHVVALDVNEEALTPTVDGAVDAPGTIEPLVVDATDRAAIEALVDARSTGGSLPHGIVNVVGGLGLERFDRITRVEDDVYDAIFERNLRATWLVSQTFAKAALPVGHSASLVHVASIVGLQAMPFGAPYAMAKAALLSLARTQALEWGPGGLRVNAIAAGTIRTPRATDSDATLDRRTLPLGRRGTPEDIARAALFLLSDLSTWITGQVIAVDGGASIKPSYLDDDGLPVFVNDDALRARLLGDDAD